MSTYSCAGHFQGTVMCTRVWASSVVITQGRFGVQGSTCTCTLCRMTALTWEVSAWPTGLCRRPLPLPQVRLSYFLTFLHETWCVVVSSCPGFLSSRSRSQCRLKSSKNNDWGLFCCVLVQCVTSIVWVQWLPIVCWFYSSALRPHSGWYISWTLKPLATKHGIVVHQQWPESFVVAFDCCPHGLRLNSSGNIFWKSHTTGSCCTRQQTLLSSGRGRAIWDTVYCHFYTTSVFGTTLSLLKPSMFVLLAGFKPSSFVPWVRCSTNWATPSPLHHHLSLSVGLSVCLSLCLSVCLSVCLCLCLSLSVSLSLSLGGELFSVHQARHGFFRSRPNCRF